MKTKLILSLLGIFMFLGIQDSFASRPPADVSATVRSEIDYPEFAIENKLEGTVYVSFSVNTNGKLVINEAHSVSPELKKYVVEQMESMKLDSSNTNPEEKYFIKFKFELL